jgi:hypothetical protein
MDIDASLVLGVNAWREAEGPPFAKAESEQVELRAVVDGVDDDGMAYLRFSADALVMVATDGRVTAGEKLRMAVPCAALSIALVGAS